LRSEQKPSLSGGDQPLPIPVVMVRLRQFLFGLRAALGNRKHVRSPRQGRPSLANSPRASLFKTDHTRVLQPTKFELVITSRPTTNSRVIP
jgi:hypothetical protein